MSRRHVTHLQELSIALPHRRHRRQRCSAGSLRAHDLFLLPCRPIFSRRFLPDQRWHGACSPCRRRCPRHSGSNCNSLCRSSLKRLFPTTMLAFGSGCRPTRCWIGRATWLPTGLPAAGASGWTSTRSTTAAREDFCHALLCRPSS